MKAMKSRILLSVILLMAALSGPLNAHAQFVTFNQFLTNTAAASASNYVGQPGYAVQDTPTFQQMQQYILNLYQGVQVSQSFNLDGQYYDCVPIQQQPTYVQLGLQSVATPPGGIGPVPQADTFAPQLGPQDQYDQYNNATSCAVGNIPMRRITIDEVSTFATLQDFFSKEPDGNDDAPTPANDPPHVYAYTAQNVANIGGNSVLNVWNPYVYTGLGQVFSLSQQWYTGGSGNNLQTVEGGWQNYPAKYKDENARLFIFWTADKYARLKCYNLDCPAFMQVNNTWILGGKFSNYSQSGGTQYYFTMTWYFYQGNWWLARGNDSGRTWVGYYPASIFRGGQMSRYATSILYGGETVGFGNFSAMGSGAFANQGYSYAAYQRQVYYVDAANAVHWANLTPIQESPGCYTVNGPLQQHNNTWGVYFYFGGPGGRGC